MDPADTERYDRQIRLWGQHGQSKCSSAKICLVNADSLGLEVIKGLCLAGIRSFVIIDSHKLTAEDIGSSLIPRNKIGKSRGEVSEEMLLDINENVSCKLYPLESHLSHIIDVQRSSEQSLADTSDFWKKFSCVVASGNLYLSQIIRLSQICWQNRIPFILCKSIGFYGYLNVQLREHVVSDTHPEWKPPNHDPNKPNTTTITTRSVHIEYENNSCNLRDDDGEDDFVTEYVCLKALDLFFSMYGRMPGHNDDQVETDIGKLKDCVKKMISKSSGRLKSLDQCLYELSRTGGAELHVTSAFLGGCVAQEVIKIVTNQYSPVDGILVYDAMTATTRTFKSEEIFSPAL